MGVPLMAGRHPTGRPPFPGRPKKETELVVNIRADASQALREMKKVARRMRWLRWRIWWKAHRGDLTFAAGALVGSLLTVIIRVIF